MLVILKPNQYSTYMKYAKVSTDGWSRLIASPAVIANKDDAPLVIWGHMKDVVEIDPVYNKPRCTAENIDKMYALQIDVDNGMKIDDFVRDYHRYAFQLYTSYSYGYKEGDRYRVIFPLAEPIRTEWLVAPVKQLLHDMFDCVDTSCFDRGHWQILPTVRSQESPYRYIQHDGERLSFAKDNFAQLAREYKEDAHWRREIAEADRDPRSNHDGALKWVQRIFDETQEGSRNRTVYAKLMWLRDTVGATYNEVISLHAPAGFDEEMNKMIERIYGYR